MTWIELSNNSDQQPIPMPQALLGSNYCCFCPLDLPLQDEAQPWVCIDFLSGEMSFTSKAGDKPQAEDATHTPCLLGQS